MTVKDQLDYKTRGKQSPNPFPEQNPSNKQQQQDRPKPCKNSLPT